MREEEFTFEIEINSNGFKNGFVVVAVVFVIVKNLYLS